LVSPSDDRYGQDVLARDPHAPQRRQLAEVPGEHGLVVECAAGGSKKRRATPEVG
jgi:hypothetical protein